MTDIDFTVERVNTVVRRSCDTSWLRKDLCFPENFIAVIALKGEALYNISGETIRMKKNDVVLFAPGTVRSGLSDIYNPWEFISVNFDMKFSDAACRFFSKPYVLFHDSTDIVRSLFVDIAYSWEGKKPLFNIKCKSLISSVLYELISSSIFQNSVPHLRRLEAARTYIQANFKQEINVEELASRLDLSISYFRKLFKEAYGISPMQYIISLRINSARDLLLSGDVNVTEAARLSGFDDIYYFSKLFKKNTGVSPISLIRK